DDGAEVAGGADAAEVGEHVHQRPPPLRVQDAREALPPVMPSASWSVSHWSESIAGCPVPPGRISRWRWGPVDFPEEPTSPMCCPAVAVMPSVTWMPCSHMCA